MNYKSKFYLQIAWEKAEEVINRYITSAKKIPHSTENTEILRSLVFPRSAIQSLLEESPWAVYFAISYHNHPPTGANRSGYSLIAFAVDEDGNVKNGADDPIFDALTATTAVSSGEVTSAQAASLIDYYQDNVQYWVQTDGHLGPVLKGFAFPAPELYHIWNNGAAKFELNLGFHPSYGLFIPQIGYTIVLVGLDAEGNRMNGDGDVFDYCHPCPTSCPIGI